MKPSKKIDRATKRKRQQWRDSKRRARAEERKYKEAMRAEARRQRLAPVEVQLGGLDLSPWIRSVDVTETREVVDITGGLWSKKGPDKWRRSVPGLRDHGEVKLELLSDGFDDGAERILNSWSREDEVRFVATRLGRVIYDGPVRVRSIARSCQVGDLVNIDVKLTPTGPGMNA